jgi:aspartate 1-decarboxylase
MNTDRNSKIVKLMKGKIHRATVTQSDLNYEGSIGIDEVLLAASGILPNEAVQVWNISTGGRLETYALPLAPHSGQICLNGAAARSAQCGDLIIICSFCWVADDYDRSQVGKVVLVDEKNRVISIH